MEQRLLEELQRGLDSSPNDGLLSGALLAARLLAASPSSDDSTGRAVVEALAQFLDRRRDGGPILLLPVVELVGEVAALRPSLSALAIAPLRPFLAGGGGRLAAAALSAVISAVGARGGFSCTVGSVMDEDLVASLASCGIVSVRSHLLRLVLLGLEKGEIFHLLRPRLVFSLLLGLSEDIYPSIRRASLVGLAALVKESGALVVECCYHRASKLIDDEEELVRMAAIRLISECGQNFALDKENANAERLDLVFLRICSMARDMSMKVRVEAFNSLAKIKVVAEKVLMQSLSKRVKGTKIGSKTPESPLNEFEVMLCRAAGAFVHGIEDEYYEVRLAASSSLGVLTALSTKFADSALNLLMDVLTDDMLVIRLQTLQSLYSIGRSSFLKIQEEYMHMFLGLLSDNSALIRHAAREVLHNLKLLNLKTLKSLVISLVANLEAYPQEEEDVVSALFCIGKNHGGLAARLTRKLAKKILPSCEKELNLDHPDLMALVILAICACLEEEKSTFDLPSSLFSYALGMFGRISGSLRGLIDRDTLLACLCHHSDLSFSAAKLELKKIELMPNQDNIQNFFVLGKEVSWPLWFPFKEASGIISKDNTLGKWHALCSCRPSNRKEIRLNEESSRSVKHIMKLVSETWPLIQSGYASEQTKALRACREELTTISSSADGCCSSLCFSLHYVEAIQIFAEILEHMQPKRFPILGTFKWDLSLERLNKCLKLMRYGFPGFCKVEESHVLELCLLGCVLQFYKFGGYSQLAVKKLLAIIARLEFLTEGNTSDLSGFTREVKKLCVQGELSDSRPFTDWVVLFILKPMLFTGAFRHIRAELQAVDNDSENPWPYISGLPAGVVLNAAVFNIPKGARLWVRLAVDDSLVQHVFLDPCQLGECDGVGGSRIDAPFYRTPNAASFQLRASVCMECPDEDVAGLEEGHGGPKVETMRISEEIDVYFVQLGNGAM